METLHLSVFSGFWQDFPVYLLNYRNLWEGPKMPRSGIVIRWLKVPAAVSTVVVLFEFVPIQREECFLLVDPHNAAKLFLIHDFGLLSLDFLVL